MTSSDEEYADSFDDEEDRPDVPFDVLELLRGQEGADKDFELTCAICRQRMFSVESGHVQVDGKCIECDAMQTERDCPISIGHCSHIYHFHCLCRWRKSRAVCPLDNQEWKTAARGLSFDSPMVKSAAKN